MLMRHALHEVAYRITVTVYAKEVHTMQMSPKAPGM